MSPHFLHVSVSLGTVFFIIRWWEPDTFSHHSEGEVGPWPPWPVVENSTAHWTWLFFVPLLAYCVWQALYFLIVEGLRRQRLLNDREVMTSYRYMHMIVSGFKKTKTGTTLFAKWLFFKGFRDIGYFFTVEVFERSAESKQKLRNY